MQEEHSGSFALALLYGLNGLKDDIPNEIRSAVATMLHPPDAWKTRLILPNHHVSLFKAQSISCVLLPMSRSRISHDIVLAIYYPDLIATTCRQQLSVRLCKKHVAWTRMLYQTMMTLPTLITLDDYLERWIIHLLLPMLDFFILFYPRSCQ